MNESKLEKCYAALSLCLSMIHNVFLIYHVEVYVYSFNIDQRYFWIGEIIFLIWNSINDPLFGYLLDRQILAGKLISKKEIISKIFKNLAPASEFHFIYFGVQYCQLNIILYYHYVY